MLFGDGMMGDFVKKMLTKDKIVAVANKELPGILERAAKVSQEKYKDELLPHEKYISFQVCTNESGNSYVLFVASDKSFKTHRVVDHMPLKEMINSADDETVKHIFGSK